MSTINTWSGLQTFASLSWTARLYGSGAAPTVSACGTTPSLSTGANDTHGTVTTGTGTVTACTVTFSAAATNTPDCVFKLNSANVVTTMTVTSAAFTVTLSASSPSAKLTYICMGQ